MAVRKSYCNGEWKGDEASDGDDGADRHIAEVHGGLLECGYRGRVRAVRVATVPRPHSVRDRNRCVDPREIWHSS
jgi:hypothetical protein